VRSGLSFVALAALGCGRFGFEGSPRDGADAPGLDGLPPGDAGTGDCALGALAVPDTGLLSGTTDGRADNAAGSCGGDGSPEVIYFLEVPAGVARLRFAGDLVVAFEATIYARSACAAPTSERACDADSGAGSNGQLLIDAPEPGPWYLFIDGPAAGAGGDYGAAVELVRGAGAACAPGTLDVCMPEHACEAGLCVPVSCATPVPYTGSFVVSGDTAGAGNLHAGTCGDQGDGGQRAPEAVHLLSLASPVANVRVTTDRPGTDYDTLVYMRVGCSGPEVGCDDDTVGLTSTFDTGPLAAGDYHIFVDGFSARYGPYELAVTVTP
jgi:hypothetical protein